MVRCLWLWFKNYCWWKKSCTSWYGKYPIIYNVLYIPGGCLGFLPSTVVILLLAPVIQPIISNNSSLEDTGFPHVLRLLTLQKAVMKARGRHRATVATARAPGRERQWATAGDGIHNNQEGGVGYFLVPGVWRLLHIDTSSARTSRGRKFQRKKTISQRKNLPIECAQGDRPARCPNHFFAVPWWWCDLF